MPPKNQANKKSPGPKKQVVQKKVSKTPPKKQSAKKQAVEKPVVEKPVVEKPVVEKPVVQKPKGELLAPAPSATMQEFALLAQDLESTLQMVRTMKTRLRDLEKTVCREQREMEKKVKNRKKRVVDPNAQPSGFAKPGPVSDELCKFLGLKAGTLIARTEVTKGINKYCKEHSLQKESDKRTILPDKTLHSLLRLKKGDEVTFFNLQKYMKVHFPNKEGVFPTA